MEIVRRRCRYRSGRGGGSLRLRKPSSKHGCRSPSPGQHPRSRRRRHRCRLRPKGPLRWYWKGEGVRHRRNEGALKSLALLQVHHERVDGAPPVCNTAAGRRPPAHAPSPAAAAAAGEKSAVSNRAGGRAAERERSPAGNVHHHQLLLLLLLLWSLLRLVLLPGKHGRHLLLMQLVHDLLGRER